jgi:hypothetical protein
MKGNEEVSGGGKLQMSISTSCKSPVFALVFLFCPTIVQESELLPHFQALISNERENISKTGRNRNGYECLAAECSDTISMAFYGMAFFRLLLYRSGSTEDSRSVCVAGILMGTEKTSQ